VRPDQQVRELPPGRSRLAEEFRDGELQQAFGEQEARFQRHAADGCLGCRIDRGFVQRLVQEPVDVLLEDLGDDAQQPLRGHALAVLDHRKVRNGGPGLWINLHASHREVFERKMVAFPEHAHLGAEEVRFAP
jgi:hypothetical protein